MRSTTLSPPTGLVRNEMSLGGAGGGLLLIVAASLLSHDARLGLPTFYAVDFVSLREAPTTDVRHASRRDFDGAVPLRRLFVVQSEPNSQTDVGGRSAVD